LEPSVRGGSVSVFQERLREVYRHHIARSVPAISEGGLKFGPSAFTITSQKESYSQVRTDVGVGWVEVKGRFESRYRLFGLSLLQEGHTQAFLEEWILWGGGDCSSEARRGVCCFALTQQREAGVVVQHARRMCIGRAGRNLDATENQDEYREKASLHHLTLAPSICLHRANLARCPDNTQISGEGRAV
jgi:hypothetical protein